MKKAADAYRRQLAKLTALVMLNFPVGTHVEVNHGRYRGPGRIVPSYSCPPDQVAVLLPNDNIWFYPVESVTRKDSK